MNDEKSESDIYNCTPHVGGYLYKKHLIHSNLLGVYKKICCITNTPSVFLRLLSSPHKKKKMNKYLRVILVVGILVLFCQVSNSGHKVFQFALDFHTTIILKNVKTKKPSTNDEFLIDFQSL